MPDDGTVSWRELEREAAAVVGAQEARWIVERVSGYSATERITHGAELVSGRSVGYFDQLLTRRRGGEPIQYVLGRWAFRSLDLFVDRRVLIPRPETETVAAVAIDHLRAYQLPPGGQRIAVDLGTGSGAIALSLASEVADAVVYATDASADALAVARANTAGIGGRVAPRVNISHGSWFAALPPELQGLVAVVVANPPYVAFDELVDDVVREWEPYSALFAEDQGRSHIAEIVGTAAAWLAAGGTLVVEMSPPQTPWAIDLANRSGLRDAHTVNDLTGRPRMIVARKR
jgi:release factor glutamine methyltransferase